ncbi:single-stranded-DNA-specific exonuclease RecJ [Synechococcales cyanobacterium C]|uniref:Single-stranded-DNA-specific exonuclease RecJ n=1 Tax=Petrachloros mirabilis ULC683 TaxID=2781853 RepID=A0A8K2A8V2_9CYAN|nr:single-stranded-DNA-specific exonuclease RecJ [Petrachloros mirabilis]NCJ07310.1 single-stranded-DNA-specific exonuclease RecJ [Petrachloros mirabilis ULC683]
MQPPAPVWQCLSSDPPPDWFIDWVGSYCDDQRLASGLQGRSVAFAAQLLWQRGIQTPHHLKTFLDPDQYQPTPASAFGEELSLALARFEYARTHQEQVWIWGDFDADGITATAVLWEGLGQFFCQNQQLHYFIPNRLTDSHGLSRQGLEQIADQGGQLIVTCDTGSSNRAEIEWAQTLGMDVIVTDHHTLPDYPLPVVAMLNSRVFPGDHPLAHLSGVAVAYKLVEALYEVWPNQAQQPLEALLDLVAIGLVADLVQLQGDCRYLTQRGIDVLRQQTQRRTRPGVARLLELCKRSGNRPMDISLGVGPRINAVSRIQGDARFCVELLTSHNPQRCEALALETELANSRRKAVQQTVKQQVEAKLAQLDLSTTGVIVLSDPQWAVGVLGLVAGEVAQAWGRPTILLAEDLPQQEGVALARGSARSVGQIDLYELVQSQGHLLHRFGGHPFAAGLSLPLENLPLFTAAINQAIRPRLPQFALPPLVADLRVTVADLSEMGGKALFRELSLLEPYGMGNRMPLLWVQNCWFKGAWHDNVQDCRGGFVKYSYTKFKLHDATTPVGIAGIWWGHARHELPDPDEVCDALVKMEARLTQQGWQYGVSLEAVRPAQALEVRQVQANWILDWRQNIPEEQPSSVRMVQTCPASWTELNQLLQSGHEAGEPLALAFQPVTLRSSAECWRELVGIAKYLVRQHEDVATDELAAQLGVRVFTLEVGLSALKQCGFDWQRSGDSLKFIALDLSAQVDALSRKQAIQQFLVTVQEEQFQQRYFQAVPLAFIEAAGKWGATAPVGG